MQIVAAPRALRMRCEPTQFRPSLASIVSVRQRPRYRSASLPRIAELPERT